MCFILSNILNILNIFFLIILQIKTFEFNFQRSDQSFRHYLENIDLGSS